MSTCIVVLGIHRSGTSAVAGTLAKLGVFMGHDLIGAGKYNPRGHWEDVAFVDLNKRIVGDWRRPLVVFEPHRKAYAELVARREKKYGLWGFKDPRMCYVFPHFMTLISPETTLKVINVSRDPVAIAKSLVNRNRKGRQGKAINVTAAQAQTIVQAYWDAKRLSLRLFTGPCLDVRYERLINDPAKVIDQLARFVGKPINDQALEFIAPKLKHF